VVDLDFCNGHRTGSTSAAFFKYEVDTSKVDRMTANTVSSTVFKSPTGTFVPTNHFKISTGTFLLHEITFTFLYIAINLDSNRN